MSKIDKEMQFAAVDNTNLRAKIKPRRSKESIISKIATKVQASKKVIADINNKQYAVFSNTFVNEVTKQVETRPFSFDTKAFLEKEQLKG